jgi:serpin B
MIDFSRNLYRAVLAEGEANPVISPLSVYFALAMVALGAEGDTAQAFTDVLGTEARQLARELASLYAHLTQTDGRTMLNLANSVWVSHDYTVYRDFNHDVRRYFGVPVRARDFSRRAVVYEINSLVHDQTEGLIGEIINEIDEDTAMLLINALYFLAHWPARMDIDTRQFYPASPGMPVTVPFIAKSFSQLPMVVAEGYIAALLVFNDWRTGFLLAMPTDGTCVRAFADRHCLNEIKNNLYYKNSVVFRMPELDKKFTVILNDVLQSMGLAVAFDADTADFSALVEEDIPLYIDETFQVARLILDRYGVEAAAVTVIITAPGSAAPLPEPYIFNFDRPFLYGIFDMDTGIPLFMGAVDNPAL